MLNNPESNLENTNTQSASMDNSVAKNAFSAQTPDENKQAAAEAQKSKTPYAKYVIVAVPVDKESVPEMPPIVQEVTLGEGIVTPSTVKAENYSSTNIMLGSGYKIYAEPIPDTVIQDFLAEPEITESCSAVQVEIVGDGVKKEANGAEPALIEEQTAAQKSGDADDNALSETTVVNVAVETDSVLLVAEEETLTEDNQVEESTAEESAVEETAQTEDTADDADKTLEEVAVTDIEGDKEQVAEEPMQNEQTAEEQTAETTDSDGAPVYEVSRDFEIKEHVSVNEATKLMTDEDAKLLVEEEENVFPLGSVEKSGTYSDKSVKDIINIDAISANFKAGDLVTLETLKEHKLVGKRTTYIKVLARGVINKPLIVEADAFSIEAIKMIVLTGGRVIRKRSK